jgi:hypothetical protein
VNYGALLFCTIAVGRTITEWKQKFGSKSLPHDSFFPRRTSGKSVYINREEVFQKLNKRNKNKALTKE